MPELPEVETIRRGLEKKIVGLTIKNLQVFYPKGVQFDPKNVEGRKVVSIWRRAKMLGVELNDITLLFHLKMTGQLIFVHEKDKLIGGHPTSDMKNQMPIKSTVAVFEFNDNSHLYFNDQRRFGWIKLIKKQDMENLLGKLGPEPLEKDFIWEILKKNLLSHKSWPIKVALMDQSVVSGIGNIYASESLFLAKIDPRRKVNSLSDNDFKQIFSGIRTSLKLALEKGGSTRAHFVNVDGERGYFLDYANVYGKAGYPCTGCKGKVEKITQAGRGTFFCPICQK